MAGVRFLLPLLLGAFSASAQLIKESNGGLASSSWNKISFMAQGALDERSGAVKGETLRYESVVHNHGRGYKPSSGVFRAPVSGTYSFSATMEFEGAEGDCVGSLFKGDERVVSGHVPFYLKTSKKPVWLRAVIPLSAGEEVSVKHTTSAPRTKVWINQEFSDFTGHLIYRSSSNDDSEAASWESRESRDDD